MSYQIHFENLNLQLVNTQMFLRHMTPYGIQNMFRICTKYAVVLFRTCIHTHLKTKTF